MSYDGVVTDSVPIPVDRDHGHGPQRGGRRRVIVETSLCRQRDRETLQCQLDLAHVHTDLNVESVYGEGSQDEEQ